jgi:hypothetical protein
MSRGGPSRLHGVRERLHHRVGELVARAEAALVGAGKVGLARHPLGDTMVIGRIRPALTGMWPWISVSKSTERMVSQITMSEVPSSGMLIGSRAPAAPCR